MQNQNIDDLYSTHPFNPLRVLAITSFWQSKELHSVLGIGKNLLPLADISKNLRQIFRVMDGDLILEDDMTSVDDSTFNIEVLNKNLRVMDSTAISLAKESKIPIIITNINTKHSIINAIRGIGKFSKIS